jgi:hypothetical protein
MNNLCPPGCSVGPVLRQRALVGAALVLLAACGGGDSAAPKRWLDATLIEFGDAGDADAPQVAMNRSGDAVAVWQQSDGTRTNIWANAFSARAGGWGASELIEIDDAGNAIRPQVALAADGTALAAWTQSDGNTYLLWVNRYQPAAGWGRAEPIKTFNTLSAYAPQLAFDNSGNALLVWHQSDGTRLAIWSSRYTPGSGWTPAERVENNDAFNAVDAQIAVDASGNAMVVWQQDDSTLANIWANRYTATTGWGTPTLVETNHAGSAYAPQVGVDARGNAYAVWSQSDGARTNIWANRFDAGTGTWRAPELLESDNEGPADGAQLAVEPGGTALAVWRQRTGGHDNIWANRYSLGSGWGAPELIETTDTGNASNPRLAYDASRQALAIWDTWDGARTSIWANHYDIRTGWASAERIETSDIGNARAGDLAMDGQGHGVATWAQHDGTLNNIWANRYE